MSTPTRILLLDDHSLFRESLVRLLESEPDFRVVAHCATVSAAIDVLQRTPIDVVLLDYDLGEERGTDLLRQLHACKSSPRVLMVTAGISERTTLDILNAGVAGVLFKHSNPTQLVDAIRKIAQGEMWLDGGIVRSLVSGVKDRGAETRNTRPLTSRQQEVLSGILDGLTNKEIAWNLKVSESSIKAVIQELFQKAGVRTRSQLVRIAIEKHAGDWLSNDKKPG
ncbi:response regulator transcription factor [Edaphobacter paludis]|uniref:Response regulator transcription factor n=1 Tax=Edaphobacter paludis TaxID=3035702 RepID=A0AAU7D461_9BACT